MPSLLSTIKYGYKKFIQPKRLRIKHLIIAIFSIILIAALTELVVFNFRAITTHFYDPIDISEKINLSQTSDERYVVSANENTIELKDINVKADNIRIKISKNQDAKLFKVKLNFTDGCHSTYFDSTEYTVGIPDVTMSTTSLKSQYFSIHSTGELKNLKLQFYGENLNYPIYIDKIIVNAHYPFDFV